MDYTYCPKCGSHHLEIFIGATIDVEFDDGNPDCQINFADDYEWNEQSNTTCARCTFTDALSAFRQVAPWPESEAPAFVWNKASVLSAIGARMRGDWDHPALVAFGPLSNDLALDIQHIAEKLK